MCCITRPSDGRWTSAPSRGWPTSTRLPAHAVWPMSVSCEIATTPAGLDQPAAGIERGGHEGEAATGGIASDDVHRLVPPKELYEVCDEDGVDVENEPESDGSDDAAHGAAAMLPRSPERPPPARGPDVVARHHHSTRSARWTTVVWGGDVLGAQDDTRSRPRPHPMERGSHEGAGRPRYPGPAAGAT